MKRRILLLMMTALLSVRAWAAEIWNEGATLNWNYFTLPKMSMTAGDVLTFHITSVGAEWSTMKLFTTDETKADWDKRGTELMSLDHRSGSNVIVVVTDDIASAAPDGIIVYGENNVVVSSVDYEKKQPTLNLYSNEEGTNVNYWGSELSKVFFPAVQKGDLLTVTIKSVGADWGANLKVTTKVSGDDNVVLATAFISPNALPTTVKIPFTDDMVAAAKSNGLYLNEGTYTYTSVDIVYAPMLANDADNTDAINYWQSISTNVTLAGRTLTKDGYWNTLCLPFAVSAEQLAESTNPLYGATIKELNASSSNLAADGTLTLAFTDASSIEAGKPYIVKWASGENVSNPLFESVTITATTPTAVEFNNAGGGKCKFVGQFSPFAINDGNKDEIIMLGSGSMLGYSQSARTLKTFRAHFEVPTTSGGAGGARAFVMNFGDEETTGIISVQGSGSMVNGSDAWYSLGGQRLQSAPTAKGVYIQNGRKVVVK